MFRLTIPLVAGIFVSDHFFQGALPVLVSGTGILGCLIGLIVLMKWQGYLSRWLFGGMVFMFLFCVGALLLQQKWQRVDYEWSSGKNMYQGANKGLVDAAGDQYTVFMNKKESTSFDDALSGNIGGGIGVEVGMRNNVPTVVRVLQDNPAEKAGVMINDIITKVNGESTEGKTLTEVTTAIRGEVGTTVKLTVLRNGEEKEFNITREQVNNPSAYGQIKDGVGIQDCHIHVRLNLKVN
jgi:membrane-associated protease RseP (regulator of RpoE activity)